MCIWIHKWKNIGDFLWINCTVCSLLGIFHCANCFEFVLQHCLIFVLSHQSCHDLHSAVEGWAHLHWGPTICYPGYIFQSASLEVLPLSKMSHETASLYLNLTYFLFSSLLWSELHRWPNAGCAEAVGDTRTGVQPKIWSGSRPALCSTWQAGMN